MAWKRDVGKSGVVPWLIEVSGTIFSACDFEAPSIAFVRAARCTRVRPAGGEARGRCDECIVRVMLVLAPSASERFDETRAAAAAATAAVARVPVFVVFDDAVLDRVRRFDAAEAWDAAALLLLARA